MPQKPVHVLLVDDHALFRQGLSFLLTQVAEFTVVGMGTDGLEGVKLAKQCRPDVVLLDLDMPLMNGLEALAQMLNHQPSLPVLMLTISEDAADLQKCMALGAMGYVLKNVDTEFLIAAIHQAMAGERVVSQAISMKLLAPKLGAAPPAQQMDWASLTQREREVLGYIAKGISNKIIADQMSLSENTVKVHVQNILRKLNLRSRVQAAIAANQHEAHGG
ncbi:response regulator [Neisseriaceae bacterium CLB008]|nr:response regulator transcription factor [Neisseriaceae bacterium]